MSSNGNNKQTKKLILTLSQCMLFEVWQSRNNIKYDNTILSQKTIITKINKQLHTICINKTLAKIGKNQLILLI